MDIKKTKKYEIIQEFLKDFYRHIEYTVTQYGDADVDLISKWDSEKIISQNERYLKRFNKNQRSGQEKKDILKMVDYLIRLYFKDIKTTKSEELILLEKIKDENFIVTEEIKTDIINRIVINSNS